MLSVAWATVGSLTCVVLWLIERRLNTDSLIRDTDETVSAQRQNEQGPLRGLAVSTSVAGHFPISCLAFSAVIAVVSTVTTGSTEVAQSSRIFFDISIASFAPVG